MQNNREKTVKKDIMHDDVIIKTSSSHQPCVSRVFKLAVISLKFIGYQSQLSPWVT